MEISATISAIIKGVESTMNNNGFAVIVPQGIEKGALPVTEKNGCTTILYGGKKGTAKIELFEGKISLFCSAAESGSAVDEDFKKVTTTLFDLETVDERDIRYAVNEINDCINDTYGKKEKGKNRCSKGKCFYQDRKRNFSCCQSRRCRSCFKLKIERPYF